MSMTQRVISTKVAATLFICFVFSSAAYSADWIEINFTGTGVSVYVDKSSIRNKGGKRLGWSKVVRDSAEPFENKMLKSWVVLHEFDCKARTQRKLSEIGYDIDGQQIYQFAEEKEAKYIVPDSMGAARSENVCKQKLVQSE